MLKVELIGDIAAAMEAEHQAGRKAVAAGVRAAGEGLKRDWRGQVVAAGLGTRLANSIRSKHYPGRPSLGAAALVYGQPSREKNTVPTVLEAFDQGATIRARGGRFLAVPTDAVPRARGGARLTPEEFTRRTGQELRFVPRPRGVPSLLVAEGRLSTGRRTAGRYAVSRSKTGRGRATVVLFLLIPQVTLRKRLDLKAAADRWAARVPGLITAAWPDR
jgi:hypothetical protein